MSLLTEYSPFPPPFFFHGSLVWDGRSRSVWFGIDRVTRTYVVRYIPRLLPCTFDFVSSIPFFSFLFSFFFFSFSSPSLLLPTPSLFFPPFFALSFFRPSTRKVSLASQRGCVKNYWSIGYRVRSRYRSDYSRSSGFEYEAAPINRPRLKFFFLLTRLIRQTLQNVKKFEIRRACMYACIRKPYLSSLLIIYISKIILNSLRSSYTEARESRSLFFERLIHYLLLLQFISSLSLYIISNRFEKFPSTFEHALAFLSTFPT